MPSLSVKEAKGHKLFIKDLQNAKLSEQPFSKYRMLIKGLIP